jgi:hypothetical protein
MSTAGCVKTHPELHVLGRTNAVTMSWTIFFKVVTCLIVSYYFHDMPSSNDEWWMMMDNGQWKTGLYTFHLYYTNVRYHYDHDTTSTNDKWQWTMRDNGARMTWPIVHSVRRSGSVRFLPSKLGNRNRNRLPNIVNCPKTGPDREKTAKNRSQSVATGFPCNQLGLLNNQLEPFFWPKQ